MIITFDRPVLRTVRDFVAVRTCLNAIPVEQLFPSPNLIEELHMRIIH